MASAKAKRPGAMDRGHAVHGALLSSFAAVLLASCGSDGVHRSPDASVPDASVDGRDSGAPGAVIDPNDPATWQPPERPDLPERPAWNPSFLPLGEPGWRTSTAPLCNVDTGTVDDNQVYADANGVYVWVHVANNTLEGGSAGGRPSGSALHFNDGTGWKELFWAPEYTGPDDRLISGITELVATSDGDVYLGDLLCGVGKWDGSVVSCSLDTIPAASDLFVTGGTSVHALGGSAIREWNGASWEVSHTLPTGNPSDLWTDGTNRVIAGPDQYVVTTSTSGVEDLSLEVPAGNYQAVWATGLHDIWLANSASQLVHFDGDEWTPIETGIDPECTDGITELWGVGDTVYFIAGPYFGRWTGTEVQLITNPGCGTGAWFTDLWGNADGSEIYLTVLDSSFIDFDCGTAFVVYFDGTEFHQL